MIIYKVTNQITKQIYIGKTVKSLSYRKRCHYKNVHNGIVSKFYNALRKYNESDFIWEEILICQDESMLNEMERFYIKKYDSFKNGYNMTLGGDGGDTISSKSNKEKKRQGAKIGNIPWNKGLPMKKMGYTFTNRRPRSKFSDEDKAQHSIKIKSSSKYINGIKNRKHGMSIQVIRLSDNKTWDTIKECSEEINMNKGTLRWKLYHHQKINGEEYVFKK